MLNHINLYKSMIKCQNVIYLGTEGPLPENSEDMIGHFIFGGTGVCIKDAMVMAA
jgi:hypothetical protein